ncbi:hypothetical protein NLX83_19880 [Allokutzneria sp. A3M-2-11 16]|uniref:hypothetical protein n=1 Tax=Allokutzneria sp. A3M-2-11 16 TaxID=2962043 RepID=UPI0020B7C8E9|nr:hypothetical protein [Allokutzneria sp. A3M-2-11 16]MCP3801523.1 hypothetical protein [Allokutzneria sp. A3M-2-11 16]
MLRTIAATLSLLSVCAFSPAQSGWQPVGSGITSGVSGSALTARGDLMIVRDNKKSGENRAALVSFPGARVTPLTWVGPVPADLEALAAVPGRPDEFVALASSGKGARISLRGNEVHVLGEFTVPAVDDDDNYEGFALTVLGGRTVAAWADRGQDERPGRLIAAEVDIDRMTFGPVTSLTIRASYPQRDVRHISDIAITDSGEVLAASASDPGDEGPFDSSLYRSARISAEGGAVALRPIGEHQEIARYGGHKIEAVTCTAAPCDHRVLGTDDESAGGAVRFD